MPLAGLGGVSDGGGAGYQVFDRNYQAALPRNPYLRGMKRKVAKAGIHSVLAIALTLVGTAAPANEGQRFDWDRYRRDWQELRERLPRESDHIASRDLAIFMATKAPPHRCFVPIVKATGENSYWVPTIINRKSSPVFLIDTGFTGSLVLPRGYLDGARADGTLTQLDRSAPPVTSTLADGSETTEETIIIREVVLPGCRAFRNVRAIISPTGAPPLLGQGILSRFSSAGIDRKETSLVLVPEGLPPDEDRLLECMLEPQRC